MPLAELPESVLFLIFLLMFVIAGVYPAWQKAAPKIRKFLAGSEPPAEQAKGRFPATKSFRQIGSRSDAYSDYDMFVFRLLAQAGTKGLSRRQIGAALHIERGVVNRTLESLNARRLIRVSIKHSIFVRFYLSQQGLEWAMEQGVVPRILAADGRE